jgi:hypothetical protein
MKKILIITIAILMVGAIATAAGLGFRAQGIKQAQVGSGRCEAFVDENGDGICDSYALRPQPQMEQVRDGLPEELVEVSKVTELQTEEPDWLAKRISLMRTATEFATHTH